MPYKSIKDRNDYQKWYRKTYPEKVKRLLDEWKSKNPDWLKKYHKNYYKSYFKTDKGKEVRRKSGRNQRLFNYNKVLARKRLNYAVEYGHIKKKICKYCGEMKVEAHHTDYSKPLNVIWLCNYHHRMVDGRLK